MFRGRNQVDGKWVTQEFDEKEMSEFLRAVSAFNKEAWKEAVSAVRELAEGDTVSADMEKDVCKLFFDKLSLNTFSVVHNRAQHLRA